ncbi:MAG: hypothetical protein CL940_09590 [Deltaproteobacteria bacterium]|nr:hypothetical protein [Deltaproteobacteria bacterium]
MSDPMTRDSEASRASMDPVLRLSALLMVIKGVTSAVASQVLIIPAGLILLSPRHLRSRAAWWSLTAIVVIGSCWYWYDVGNHNWVIMAWIIGCALAVSRDDTEHMLRTNAKTMLAIVFIAGGLQKLILGAWHNGLFLELYASRNPWTAELFGFTELGRQQFLAVQLLIRTGIIEEAAFYLTSTDSTRVWLVIISWITVLAEVGIGALFVLRSSPRTILWRTSGLLAFIWLVYPFAPVTGFAWILLILTAATLPSESTALRRACWISLGWVIFCPYINDADEIVERIARYF